MDLKGKVALVTGAGTGIGKGVAIELARCGAKVGVNYNSSIDGALDTKQMIEALGGEAKIVQTDISDKDQVKNMVNIVMETFGSIDVLVNNSAYQPNINLMDYDELTYDKVMSINIKGYFLCTQAVIPFMKEKGKGRIINISSVHGKRPSEFDPVYSMTKGAIKMLTRESAIEFGRYGITVNTLEPGAVRVGKKSGDSRPIKYNSHWRPDAAKVFPIGRAGLPQDIGYMVTFLASDESEYITGSSIRMDGGSMLVV